MYKKLFVYPVLVMYVQAYSRPESFCKQSQYFDTIAVDAYQYNRADGACQQIWVNSATLPNPQRAGGMMKAVSAIFPDAHVQEVELAGLTAGQTPGDMYKAYGNNYGAACTIDNQNKCWRWELMGVWDISEAEMAARFDPSESHSASERWLALKANTVKLGDTTRDSNAKVVCQKQSNMWRNFHEYRGKVAVGAEMTPYVSFGSVLDCRKQCMKKHGCMSYHRTASDSRCQLHLVTSRDAKIIVQTGEPGDVFGEAVD